MVAHQSGKGQILLALELFGLYELDEQLLHTAHAGTARYRVRRH